MQYLSLLSPIVLVIGLVIGVLHFKKYPKIAKLILGYFFLQLVVELTSRYFGFVNAAKNNLFLFSIVAILDVLFYTSLYYFFILQQKRVWLLGLIATGLTFLIIIMSQKNSVPLSSFDSYEKVIADACVCLLAVISSFEMVTGKNNIKTGIMRINAAVLLYFSLDILISLTSNFLINAGASFIIYFWLLRLILLLFLYSIFTTTLWHLGRNRKL